MKRSWSSVQYKRRAAVLENVWVFNEKLIAKGYEEQLSLLFLSKVGEIQYVDLRVVISVS